MDETNSKMVLKGRGLDSKGKGSADMIMNGTLKHENGVTHVNFSMDITIVGMLAQFGSAHNFDSLLKLENILIHT